jgi:hypothetical protein
MIRTQSHVAMLKPPFPLDGLKIAVLGPRETPQRNAKGRAPGGPAPSEFPG